MIKVLIAALFLIFLFGFVSYVLYFPLANGFGNLAWTPTSSFLTIIMFALPLFLITFLGFLLYLRREQ